MVNKAGPYFDPQFEIALKKIALQSGVSTPSEVGLKLEPNKKGEKPALLLKQPTGPTTTKKKGTPQQGRPKNSKDTKKRQTRTFKPVGGEISAELLRIWATDAQEVISKILNPGILAQFKKKNMRSLTAEQTKKIDLLKFSTLYYLEPMSIVTEQSVITALNCGNIDAEVYKQYNQVVDEISDELDRTLTVDEMKQIQSLIYTNVVVST
jgi:hypothetical protein